MKPKFIIIFGFLVNCYANKTVIIANVDTKANLALNSIDKELINDYNKHLFIKNDSGVSIIVDSVRLGLETDNKERHGIGIYLAKSKEIILPDPNEFVIYDNGSMFLVNKDYFKVLLAHELAHSIGVEHSESSRLMNEFPSIDCIDKIAECFLEAIE